MKQYLHIIQNELPTVSEEDLFIPISQTHIDSLDIVVIRVTLEKHFGIEVSDSAWYQYQTLADALEYFHKNKDEISKDNNSATKDTTISETIELRMPQMANCALSESWLLKYLGDTHWLLLSKGFDKKSSEFKDNDGNRLYATFVRINYSTTPLRKFKENDLIDFNSKIEGFGSNTFISNITGKCLKNEIQATLLTTFSIRDKGYNNNEIYKGNLNLIPGTIGQLAKTPIHLNDYRLLKKGLLEEIPSIYGSFRNSEEIIFSCEYDINLYYDINGVGLLYFAAYPIISDSCCLYFNDSKLHLYQTIYRDIFYFANCNPDDKIIFKLNYIDKKENLIKTLTSLYRKSDHKLLAKILTVKQKV